VRARPNLLSGEDLPSKPRQKRSIAKQARLKTAALALFGEQGYEKSSIEQIARRAKLATGTFYQHFRSKRQLLLVLMDDLLGKLAQVSLRPESGTNVRAAISEMLTQAFAHDLHYLGAYRAWKEAALSDPELANKEAEIHTWTIGRVMGVLQLLQQLPGARAGLDLAGMARVLDGLFWSLLTQAVEMPKAELSRWVDSASHLIYHGMFADPAKKSQEAH
jgi:AcrR family transcriptional regulator